MNTLVHQLFIAGSGIMGGGIAQVAASAGINVTLFDVNAESLQRALANMRWSMEKLHSKGLLAEPADTVLARVRTSSDLSDAAGADAVIEAVPEREEIKHELFARLDAICPPHVWFASNTSAIPITKLAASTKRTGKFCGMHFFNPVPMLALVEIIRGGQTDETTLEAATSLARQLGKEPVMVKHDCAGFIVNRILGAAIGEAARLVEAGVADAADVDKAMRLGCAWKMGPLETSDLAGLDVVLHMFEAMQREKADPVLAPPALLKQLVAEGKLGRKSGAGFYSHTTPPA